MKVSVRGFKYPLQNELKQVTTIKKKVRTDMSRLELRLKNHSMNLELIACIGDSAFLKRLNDNSFIVVRGLQIHNDFTCEWDFALGYFEDYDRAYTCFNRKVIKDFQDYESVAINNICKGS